MTNMPPPYYIHSFDTDISPTTLNINIYYAFQRRDVIDFKVSHIDDSYHFPLICQFKFQQIIKEKSDEIKYEYEQSPIFK